MKKETNKLMTMCLKLVLKMAVSLRERERQTDRQTETETQIDRPTETDRQTDTDRLQKVTKTSSGLLILITTSKVDGRKTKTLNTTQKRERERETYRIW